MRECGVLRCWDLVPGYPRHQMDILSDLHALVPSCSGFPVSVRFIQFRLDAHK